MSRLGVISAFFFPNSNFNAMEISSLTVSGKSKMGHNRCKHPVIATMRTPSDVTLHISTTCRTLEHF